MLDWLVKRFVRDSEDLSSPETRSGYGMLAGIMGMALNFLLFAVKLPIGLITGSVAITSDAFNNVTDMGSSLVTVIGMRIAARRPDKKHPFGHGRMEYVATFIIAIIIMFVGLEMLKESIEAFVNPQKREISWVLASALILSCAIKLWMFYYNRSLGKRIESDVLIAASIDSVSDAITTFLVVAAALLESYVNFPLDAIASLGVSALILKNGIQLCVKTVNRLLGGEVDKELRKKIFNAVIQSPSVLGAHDLIVHDYGPGRVMASVHVEIDSKSNLMAVHEEINEIETDILQRFDVPIVIHMDPVVTGSESEDALFRSISNAVYGVDRRMRFHDMQVYERDGTKKVEFDLLVPDSMTAEQSSDAVQTLKSVLDKRSPGYTWDINVEGDVYN